MTSEYIQREPRQPLVQPGGMDLHRADMTATFAGDVTLESAQRSLGEIGQWLPIDGNPSAKLSDLVLFNSTGSLRLGYGAWRDLLLGMQFTNGRGELISAGGRTVKNVAGYDLTKFIVGSAGVFGRIVSVTTRTYRRPAAALLARFAPDAKLVGRLVPSPLKPQWALMNRETLLCGYFGDAATREYYRSALGQMNPIAIVDRSVEEDLADRAARWRPALPNSFRAAVPPTRIAEMMLSLPAVDWIADAAFGIVLGSSGDKLDEPAIERAAKQVGGGVRFFRGDGAVSFSTDPVERQMIERLKKALDPDGTLNPLPEPIR